MSKLCDQVIGTLRDAFPQMRIVTEYSVLYNKQRLFVDIWVPQLFLAIEVHGRQHDEYVRHFHNDAAGFAASKKRDALKEEWAKTEGVTYVVLRENQLPVTKETLLEIISNEGNN